MCNRNYHPDKERWNEKYESKGLEAFGSKPSTWLKDHESLLSELGSKKALDIACGNGRNSIYLANIGFQVDAVDISDVAINWLNNVIKSRGYRINAIQLDLESEYFPDSNYDLIINFNYLERSLFPKIKNGLKSEGLLFFETVYIDYKNILKSDMSPKFMLDYNELLHSCSDMRVLKYREEIVLEESYSKKEKALASIISQKK